MEKSQVGLRPITRVLFQNFVNSSRARASTNLPYPSFPKRGSSAKKIPTLQKAIEEGFVETPAAASDSENLPLTTFFRVFKEG